MSIVFNIDEKAVQEGIDKATKEAIEAAFEDYQVRSTIREQVANHLVGGVMRDAIQQAVRQIDIDTLATAMAKQLAKAAVTATHHSLLEAVASMVMKLRGWSSYDDEGGAKRNKIIAELRHNMKDHDDKTPADIGDGDRHE